MMSNIIVASWRKPFNRECRPDADLHGYCVTAVCGDLIDLYLYVTDDVIRDAFFDGEGCIICLGMASLTTQTLVGKTMEAARKLTEDEILQLATDVKIDQRRRDCALVAFNALRAVL